MIINDLPQDILRKIALIRKVQDEALIEINQRFQSNVRYIINTKRNYINFIKTNEKIKKEELKRVGNLLKNQIKRNVENIQKDLEKMCKINNKNMTFKVEDNEDFLQYLTNISNEIQKTL